MPAREGEFARIRELIAGLPLGTGVVLGPGDDAAVVRPRAWQDLVVTTDTFVEGRHFRRDLLDAAAIGRRLAAANLSDLAAMGAQPRWAVIACTAPRAYEAAWLRDVEWACAAALAADGATVVGGNLAAIDGPCCWSVTLMGEVERGRHWGRTGAQPGDVLAVTGSPGRAAAALGMALRSAPPSFAGVPAPLVEAFLRPASRVRVARALVRVGGVRAAIDLSDGLCGDLAHLALASGVGAVIRAAALPAIEGDMAQDVRFGPSDDYELLLAIDAHAFAACAAVAAAEGAPLTAIGEVTADSALLLERADGRREALQGAGWDHFA